MPEVDLIRDLIVDLGALPAQQNERPRKDELAGLINELLNSDFQRLVAVLYRMDINETLLREILKDNVGTDAGQLIADMMIERQLEKIKTRREFRRDNDIDEEEKW